MIRDLRVEHRDPFGIGTATPRLSWIGEADQVEIDGRAYPVDGSVLVPWPAPPLASRQAATVRVGDAELVVEAGLLEPSDWSARFAAPDVAVTATAVLRRSFTATPGHARLYITALGVYELSLNGERVGDHVLAPGWTSYDHRLRYQTFDVGDLLVAGENRIEATLADGWFRGRLGFGGGRYEIYGDRLALLAQLEVDGDPVVVTDGDWEWAAGPTTRASIYDGEDHDARRSPEGWAPVELLDRDPDRLFAPLGPPVRVTEEVRPVGTTTSPSGATIVDFGQNLVGRLRLTTSGDAGDEVVLRHAEILEDGELCTAPLNDAEATDRYTLSGTGTETWSPRFTFHGFRFAEVTGRYRDVVAEVCHSDLRRTGWFECSDERVNQLHQNVVWGMRGNFLDVPTDCPQRSERLGWTGDIAIFAPTACFLFDVAGFLSSWCADLAADQGEGGNVPWVVPDVMGPDWMAGSGVWGDAAVAVPSAVHERYADTGVLEAQWPSMQGWVDHVLSQTDAPGHWAAPFHFGDWVDPASPPDDPGAARTDKHLVSNAWFCHTLRQMGDAAEALGTDVDRWRSLEAEFREDFDRRYVNADGTMTSDAQTAYALAIRFGLGNREVAGERLVALVEEEDHRIGTGFVGTPLITDALCDVGAVDTAYRLLLQTECPSWLYPVTQGATTIWERWDSLMPDGQRNPGGMNSFNHYALGAVADWLHRRVGGLAPAAAGYARLRIAPLPGPGLDHATATLDTPYGRAASGWRRDGEEVVITASLPRPATVELPDGSPAFDVDAGSHEWRVPG